MMFDYFNENDGNEFPGGFKASDSWDPADAFSKESELLRQPSAQPYWGTSADSAMLGGQTVKLLTGLPGWNQDQGSRAIQDQDGKRQAAWNPDEWEFAGAKQRSVTPVEKFPWDSFGQDNDAGVLRGPNPTTAKLPLDGQGFPQFRSLYGYEDEHHDTPPNERPFLLFQRNGSPIQHRDLTQAAIELFQEASANKRAGLGFVGEERADEASGLGGDGSDENDEDKQKSMNASADSNQDPLPGEPKNPWNWHPFLDQADLPKPTEDCDPKDQCDNQKLSDSQNKLFGEAARKAERKHRVSAEVPLAMAEQEMRGKNSKFTHMAGNGVLQIQRGDYLDYLVNTGQMSAKERELEKKSIAGNTKPFSRKALEDRYYNDVNSYDTAFDITTYNLRRRGEKYGLDEAIRMHNQGENYKHSDNPDRASRLANTYYNKVAWRIPKYVPLP